MVLLAAAVCSKNGKALLSRQFVEMTKARVEGLLSAFPTLMKEGQQHTFVETESVRYVYQPLDKLYMLLITTKTSNILEDLETLRLFSRVVPDCCKCLEDKEILKNGYELLFAFDETVALGYRENVNLQQIRTFIEMDSHEERVINAVRKSQELEAKEQMKRKAKELQAAKPSSNAMSYIKGIANRGGSTGSMPIAKKLEVGDTAAVEVPAPAPVPKRPTGGNALRLGCKNKDVDAFVDKLKSEGTNVASTVVAKKGPAVPAPTCAISSVHVKFSEKLNLKIDRHGSLENMEVIGMMMLKISDPQFANVVLAVDKNDSLGFNMQTHPNVDKKLFSQDNKLAIKQGGKGFPLNTEIGVLKCRLQTKDENLIPLTINCWPNENGSECEVTIEYELQLKELELNDVRISIPVPSGVGAPVIGEVTGEYTFDNRKSILEWQVAIVDEDNASGSLDFTIPGSADDFFPINISFYSKKTLCDIQITEVKHADSSANVQFSQETSLCTEKCEVA